MQVRSQVGYLKAFIADGNEMAQCRLAHASVVAMVAAAEVRPVSVCTPRAPHSYVERCG
jgi:hypothetical protein